MRTPTLLRTRNENTPNMTPLVDVVMVILIFLMLAGSFAGRTRFLKSKHPIAGATGGNNTIDVDLMISPTADGGYIIHAGKITTHDVNVLTRELTGERLAYEQAGNDVKQIPVVLRPTSRVRYDQVIEIYQAALKAGFSKVQFAKTNS